jgi:hypothetical protein
MLTYLCYIKVDLNKQSNTYHLIMNFYVIFEGGTIGVYDSCSNCRMLVFNDNSNNYQIYKDSDEVDNVWEIYCKYKSYLRIFVISK